MKGEKKSPPNDLLISIAHIYLVLASMWTHKDIKSRNFVRCVAQNVQSAICKSFNSYHKRQKQKEIIYELHKHGSREWLKRTLFNWNFDYARHPNHPRLKRKAEKLKKLTNKQELWFEANFEGWINQIWIISDMLMWRLCRRQSNLLVSVNWAL